MKTSLFEKLKTFIKSHWKIIVLVCAVIILSVFSCVRESVVRHQTAKIVSLEQKISDLDQDRQLLEKELEIEKAKYSVIEKVRDSLKVELEKKERQLTALNIRHRRQVDSLLNIPNDTVYVRLQPIYPKAEGEPLKYPFTGSQIRKIYSVAISYPLLANEYNLQTGILKTCRDLNVNYEAGARNLNGQIINLQKQVGIADEQISNYKAEVNILGRQVKKNKFWKRVAFITTGIATGIAVLK